MKFWSPKGTDPYLHYFCPKCDFPHSIAFFKWFYHISYWFWWYYEKGEYAGRWEIQIQTNHVRWKSSLMSSIDLEHFHEKWWKKWWNCFQNVKKYIFIHISPLFSPLFMIFASNSKTLHSAPPPIVVCPNFHFSWFCPNFTAMICHDLKIADHGTSLIQTLNFHFFTWCDQLEFKSEVRSGRVKTPG